ncbi:hypothetical protein BJ165DRAFT_1156953 [Panaeolus papilionaceus]|nr:hypothetical protein BJ165DRAFT_1156953 [Panaeolus papilionaceus]
MIATNGPGIILISQYRPNPYPLMLVFTALVVDTLMLWRCLVFSSSLPRWSRCLIFTLPTLLTLGSFVTTIILISLGHGKDADTRRKITCVWIAAPFIGLSSMANLYLAIFVVLFFIRHRKCQHDALGTRHDTLYQRIIRILVESFSPIVLSTLIYYTLWFTMFDATLILQFSLIHAYTISPLLLLIQVAQRKALQFTTSPRDASLAFIGPSDTTDSDRDPYLTDENGP